jgi:hypothetical protein
MALPKTKSEFVDYMMALRIRLRDCPDDWENHELSEFLGGMCEGVSRDLIEAVLRNVHRGRAIESLNGWELAAMIIGSGSDTVVFDRIDNEQPE